MNYDKEYQKFYPFLISLNISGSIEGEALRGRRRPLLEAKTKTEHIDYVLGLSFWIIF